MCKADAAYALTRWQHFSAWNDAMAAILKVWRALSEIRLRKPISNDGAFLIGFLWMKRLPQELDEQVEEEQQDE